MQKNVLTLAMGSGFKVLRFTLDHNDLTAAAATQVITLIPVLNADDIVMGSRIKHSVAFTGGGLASMTVSIDGSVDGVAGFGTAFDIFQAVADTTLQMEQLFKNGTIAGQIVRVTFTAGGGGGTVDLATAGVVNIDLVLAAVTTSATQ